MGAQGRGASHQMRFCGSFFRSPTSLVSSSNYQIAIKNGSTRKSSHLVKTWYSKSYLDELMSGMEGCCWLSMRLTDIGTFFPLPPSTFHRRRSPLLKTGFSRQVMELKLQRKNPGSALLTRIRAPSYRSQGSLKPHPSRTREEGVLMV